MKAEAASQLWSDYDVEGHSPRMAEWLQEYERRSRRAYEELHAERDIRYGEHPREMLDLFRTPQNSDLVLVFIHGGFWRAGLKENAAHLASMFVPGGWNFITVEYPLVSDVPFAQLVGSMRRLANALPSIVAARGIPRPRFVLCGSSAGAHLAANMVAYRDGAVAGLILLGGVYDLEPLMHTPAQEWLKLTAEAVERFSPAKFPLWRPRHPILLAVGSDDRPGLHRQAEVFHRRLQQEGHDSRFMMASGDCHFSIVGRIGDPGRALGHSVLHLLEPVDPL